VAVLVLGGYGLIGSAIVARLEAEGAAVVGLGRDTGAAARRWPGVEWRRADLGKLLTAEAWRPLLADIDVIVNAVGVLQQGLGDDPARVQDRAMQALYAAAREAGVRRVVQVSAVGARPDSPLAFLSSKARADEGLRRSGLEHVILKPALVIAPAAYGGTALLRGLAAFPGLVPLVLPKSPVQALWIGDLADAAAAAVAGRIPSGATLDLAEPAPRTLAETVLLMRAWLGLAPAPVLPLPAFAGNVAGAGADLLGWLGWRSPLRSTALAVMRGGVTGDGGAAEVHLGRPLKSLPQMLAAMPAGAQERWFARLWLLKPVILGVLAAFWLTSGALGLTRLPDAAAVLTGRGAPADLARLAVVAGSAADLALGAAVLVRPLARWALAGMAGLSLVYMAGAAIFAPQLWLDPLGPMVKAVPALVLALVALAILDDR
jgi:uncharacterized protein YbjT (DUF2867 family)